MRNAAIIFTMLVLIWACQRDQSVYVNSAFAAQFHEPRIVYPSDNLPTPMRVELGKYLFYNPAMSLDSNVSCASCHMPEFAFTDNRALGIGNDKQLGNTNSPSLSNIGYNPYFTRAGGVPSLEIQVLVPIQEHNEFNNNLIDITERLKNDVYFVAMAKKTYPNKPLYFAITASIAAFERTFVSKKSKFDKYLEGKKALSINELKGMQLFFSNQTNCSKCHSGFNFTNYQFENNGAANINKDSGRYRLTRNISDVGLFKVPSLRNIEVTGPYMHDGSINSLASVLESYNKGGIYHYFSKSELIKPLGLDKTELLNLEAYLNTLTDYNFINNPNFKSP